MAHVHRHRHDDGHVHHHSHGHSHSHPHAHGPLEAITHVHGGPLVLDIGGDVGALVLLVDRALLGSEVHVATVDGRITHTGVWLRSIGPVDLPAAVFCQLPAGIYTLLDPGWAVGRSVRIDGGGVVEVDLRRADRAA